jgi:hypothetical protein
MDWTPAAPLAAGFLISGSVARHLIASPPPFADNKRSTFNV